VIVVSLLCAPVSRIDEGVTPSWVVYPIALLIALWRFRRGCGAMFVGIAAPVFLAVHVPWSYAALTGADTNQLDRESPSSPVQWLITLLVVPVLTSSRMDQLVSRKIGPGSPPLPDRSSPNKGVRSPGVPSCQQRGRRPMADISELHHPRESRMLSAVRPLNPLVLH